MSLLGALAKAAACPCEDGERYYVSYLPDFERSSDSTMVEEPRA